MGIRGVAGVGGGHEVVAKGHDNEVRTGDSVFAGVVLKRCCETRNSESFYTPRTYYTLYYTRARNLWRKFSTPRPTSRSNIIMPRRGIRRTLLLGRFRAENSKNNKINIAYLHCISVIARLLCIHTRELFYSFCICFPSTHPHSHSSKYAHRISFDNKVSTTRVHVNNFILQESKSSATAVTLFPLTRDSNGNYKCEVSTDAPNFPTVVDDANMTVIGKNYLLIVYIVLIIVL